MRIHRTIRTFAPLLCILLVPTITFAASITVSWQANSEPDIAGYNIYYGMTSRQYGPPIPVGKITSHVVDNLSEDTTYYFALTAVDTSGNESGYSPETSARAITSEPTQIAPSSGSNLKTILLATNMYSPQPEGRIIQLSTQTTGSDLICEYKFQIRKTGQSEWKLLRNYATESFCLWDTSGKKGKWDIRVKVRDQNRPSKIIGIDKIKKFRITANKPTDVTISSNLQGPQPSNTIIVFQTIAEGGVGDYEYLYQIAKKNNGQWKKWQNVTPWNTSSDYSWEPSRSGKFKIRTKVRMEGLNSKTVPSPSIIFKIDS